MQKANNFGFKTNCYRENSLDVFIPEMWANESIMILVENMVASRLVYRNFSTSLARMGDVVHVAKPGELVATRKTNADNVTIQDVSATDVQVALNQHVHCSILIRDGEESKSFKSLVDEFLRPEILALAKFIDKIVLGQYPRFLANSAGMLGGITANNAKGYILGLRRIFNTNKAPMTGRNLILNPVTETDFLNLDIFTQAQMVGDQGQALLNATLGRRLGWDMYMDQNMAVVSAGNTVVTALLVNNGAGYPAGTTTMTVDGIAGGTALTVGQWFTVAGDLVPHRVVSSVGGTTPTSVTFTPGLGAAVVNDAVITTYTPGAVNLVAGYAAGYAKEIVVDAFSVAPQVGQFVSFGASSTAPVYTIINVSGLVGITLDRPLDEAIVNDAAVNIGPAGNYNFAFHQNAVALVTRPLALPMSGTGARAAVTSFNDVALRVCITYNGEKQGHLVTVDLLAGVAVLDTSLGGVLLG